MENSQAYCNNSTAKIDGVGKCETTVEQQSFKKAVFVRFLVGDFLAVVAHSGLFTGGVGRSLRGDVLAWC
jgi:hypothetical protein